MGNGRSAGRASGARLGSTWGFLLLLALLAVPAMEMRAAASLRPLDRHAVVVNGSIVGSAFAIAEGVAVTNRHVVQGLRPGARVRLLASGPGHAVTAATVLALSPRMDLAVLAVPKGLLPVVPAAPAAIAPGLAVIAVGVDASDGPGGPRYEAAGEVIAPTAEIAAFGPGLIARLPQGRPGFSGGPLFDRQGRLLGMVTALRPGSGAIVAAAGPGMVAQPKVEAYALRAAAIRAEVIRLLEASRQGR
jgi:S1-C subfamily serine protease